MIFDDLNFAFRDYDPFVGLRPVQDRQRAVRGRRDRPLGARRDLRQRADAGRDRDQPAAPRGPALDRAGRKARASRLKTPEQGAATSVLLAASPELEGVGGRYFEDCDEAEVVERRGERGSGGVAPYALDADNADRLWELSERLLGAHAR